MEYEKLTIDEERNRLWADMDRARYAYNLFLDSRPEFNNEPRIRFEEVVRK